MNMINTPLVLVFCGLLTTAIPNAKKQSKLPGGLISILTFSTNDTIITKAGQADTLKNNIKINGELNVVKILSQKSSDKKEASSSANQIDIQGTNNTVKIIQEVKNGKVVIHQNGKSNKISIKQNKSE